MTRAEQCPASFTWPRTERGRHTCPDCGAEFKRGQLQGRDDRMPDHARANATGAALLAVLS